MKKVFKRLLAVYFKARTDKWLAKASLAQLNEFCSILRATVALTEERIQAQTVQTQAVVSASINTQGGWNDAR